MITWVVLGVLVVVVLLAGVKLERFQTLPGLFDAMEDQKNAVREYGSAKGAMDRARAQATVSLTHAASSVPFARKLLGDPRAKKAAQRVLDLYSQLVVKEGEARHADSVSKVTKAAEEADALRIEIQDALLWAMLFSTDPIRKVQVPTRKFKECTRFDGSSRDLKQGQRRLVAYLESKGKELLAHMLQKYPNDPVTKNMDMQWARRVVPMTIEKENEGAWMAANGGKYGCVQVNMRLTGSVPRSLTRLIHELSHVSARAGTLEQHTPLFYATQRKLLRIATEELGWTVENWCRETCDLSQDPKGSDATKACPRCYWQRDPVLCVADLKTNDSMCRPRRG